MGYIVGVGATNLDVMGRSGAALIPEDSNPGRIAVSVGGATHNAVENAARLGVPVRLVTAVGDDLFAVILCAGCERAGISANDFFRFPGTGSSCYLSAHDRTGEMYAAISDMHVLQKLLPNLLEKKKELLLGAEAVVFDNGLPVETIRYLQEEIGTRVPLFCDPVSTTYALKLKGNAANIHTIKPNRMEAEVLSGMEIRTGTDVVRASEKILTLGPRRVFMSLGRNGLYYADAEGNTMLVRPQPMDRVENATGAGDSMNGALLWAFHEGMDLEATMKSAVTVSVLTIRSEPTIRQDLSPGLVRDDPAVFLDPVPIETLRLEDPIFS